MTLQEAIEKEKSIAKSNYELADSYHTDFNVYMRQEGACRERAEYHEQVAEWLKELKQLREQTWSLDDAREDFLYDVYKTLESLPTNDEANRIIEVFDRVTSDIRQEPILDKIRAEIRALSPEPTAIDVIDGNPIKDAVWETLIDVLQIIDKYKTESEG